MPTATDHTDVAARPFLQVVGAGASTGVGSLPHRDARVAADFSLREHEIAVVPSLPKRSPAEGMIAQAVVGVPGVSLVQYGSISVDVDRLDPSADVVTDLAADAFVGFRVFLDVAAERGVAGRPVKWQFVGPVTLGVALVRAGVPAPLAFDVAGRAVQSHVRALGATVGHLKGGGGAVLGDRAGHDYPGEAESLPVREVEALIDCLRGVEVVGEVVVEAADGDC